METMLYKLTYHQLKDSIILEGKESPYANILVVRKGDEKKEDIQKLLKALRSQKSKKTISIKK